MHAIKWKFLINFMYKIQQSQHTTHKPIFSFASLAVTLEYEATSHAKSKWTNACEVSLYLYTSQAKETHTYKMINRLNSQFGAFLFDQIIALAKV